MVDDWLLADIVRVAPWVFGPLGLLENELRRLRYE